MPFNVKNLNLYNSTSDIKCYYFILICEDYFVMTRAKGYKHIYFAFLS